MTGVQVIIESFWPEVRKMLPEIEHKSATKQLQKSSDDINVARATVCIC